MMTAKSSQQIYLDYAATTPLDPRVRERMLDCMDADIAFGNPSSSNHEYGAAAAAEIEKSAAEVAGVINAQPDELVWTSGATEANNLAVIGAAKFREQRGRHVVTSVTEHKSVLASCASLEAQGFEVSYLKPDAAGRIAKETLAAAMRPDTVLVSLMHANNEIGVIQDIAAAGELCRTHDVLLHVDAVQTAGRVTVDVEAQQIDLLSLNAHKACGPKGIGALYMNSSRIRRVDPILFGGSQQRGLRPGTLPTHQIVGMGTALALAHKEMLHEVPRIDALRKRLWSNIEHLPGVVLNGDTERSLCSILNVSVAAVEGESLRYALRSLAVASGSACNSAIDEPSYVLRSLGRSDQLAEASIRFSLGRFTTTDEVDAAGKVFCEAVEYLQAMSGADVSAGLE